MKSVTIAEQKSALASVVTIDKEVLHGIPCFANTRVPVQTLIDFLETGETIDEFLAVYPTIPKQQVFNFLELSRDIAIDQLIGASSSTPQLIHDWWKHSPTMTYKRCLISDGSI